MIFLTTVIEMAKEEKRESFYLWESNLKFVLPVFPNLLGFQFSSTLLGLSSIRTFTVILLLLLSANNICAIPHRFQVWLKTDHQCCEGTRCSSANTSAQTAMTQKSIRVMYMKCSRPGSFWASAISESVCICAVCVLVCVCVFMCVCTYVTCACLKENRAFSFIHVSSYWHFSGFQCRMVIGGCVSICRHYKNKD